MGFIGVYDHVAGKVDWLAAGPSTVRAEPTPRVIDSVSQDLVTCDPSEEVAGLLQRMQEAGRSFAVVLNDHRVILGRIRTSTATGVTGRVEDVMEPGPATVRAAQCAYEDPRWIGSPFGTLLD